MPHFTKQMETKKGFRTFYFNRIYTVNGTKFHVSVKDVGAHYFMMMERNGAWFIADPPLTAGWIVDMEKQLEAAFFEHLKQD